MLNKVNYMKGRSTMEWTDMMHYQRQVQKVMRSLLPVRKSALTASECELGSPLSAAGPKHPGAAQPGQRHEKGGREPLLEIAL